MCFLINDLGFMNTGSTRCNPVACHGHRHTRALARKQPEHAGCRAHASAEPHSLNSDHHSFVNRYPRCTRDLEISPAGKLRDSPGRRTFIPQLLHPSCPTALTSISNLNRNIESVPAGCPFLSRRRVDYAWLLPAFSRHHPKP